jgi:hypothetical protein
MLRRLRFQNQPVDSGISKQTKKKGIPMKTFLAVYLGSPAGMDAWRAMDEDQRKQKEAAGIEAWHAWVQTNANAIVDQGGPLGKTKRVSKHGIADVRNEMGAYTVVQAESHEAAAKLFENHPHFTFFPGDAVEVMERLPIPGM